MPSADFCDRVEMNRFIPSHDFVTRRRSPEVSSTAFDAQPPDLPPVSLMDMGFAIVCSLARHRRPHIRFLFIGSRLGSTLLSGPASRRVLFPPLRFAMTSPPSGCQRDFHPRAVEHVLLGPNGPRNHMKTTSSGAQCPSLERRGRPSIGEVEAVNMSDPERALLSE